MAMEVCAQKFYSDFGGDGKKVIFRQLNATSIHDFFSDLDEFYREKGILQKNFRIWNWNCAILQIYDDMNNYYPEAYKLIILDDVEEISEVLRLLNHISIIMTPQEMSFWKIVVTTQKKPTVSDYPKIGADKFIQIQGFNSQNVNELLQPLQLETKATERIYEALGSSPLALTLFMEQLNSFQVGRQL